MKKVMKFRQAGAEEIDSGEWMVLHEVAGRPLPIWTVYDGDPDTAEEPLVKVRAVHDAKLREIRFRHHAKEDPIFTREGLKPNTDPVKEDKVNQAVALLALIDTRLIEIDAVTPGVAQRYTELLGREVHVGEEIRLDKQWDRPGLKDYVISELQGFANYVVGAQQALKARDEVTEGGKA